MKINTIVTPILQV